MCREEREGRIAGFLIIRPLKKSDMDHGVGFLLRTSEVLISVICILAVSAPQCCISVSDPHQPKACCISKEKTFGPYVSYITLPYHAPKAAVIIATDVYGFKAPLLRLFADKVASAGYFVVVPDFFNGDPVGPNTSVTTWLPKHEPLDSVPGAKQVIELLHKKGYSSIGAVGFCWGGKLGVELAKGKLLKAFATAHPAFITVDDIREVKVPIEILAAELDTVTPASLIRQLAAVLKSRPEIKSFVKIYPGVGHGWAIRYNTTDPEAVAAAEKAQRKLIEWLNKFVHPRKA